MAKAKYDTDSFNYKNIFKPIAIESIGNVHIKTNFFNFVLISTELSIFFSKSYCALSRKSSCFLKYLPASILYSPSPSDCTSGKLITILQTKGAAKPKIHV